MTHKLSVHAGSQPTGLSEFLTIAQPRMVYVLNNSAPAQPGLLTVRRVQNDIWGRLPDAMGVENYFRHTDPVAAARYELLEKRIVVPKVGSLNWLDYMRLSPANYYALYNEPVLGESVDHVAKASWLNAYTCEALRLAHAEDMRLCIFSFASSNPHPDTWPALAEAVSLCAQYQGIIDLHAYGIEGPLFDSPSSGAFFYRQFHAAFPDCPLILLSEASAGNGYNVNLHGQAWIDDLLACAQEWERDAYLWGACAFQLDQNAESHIDLPTLIRYAQQAATVEETMPTILGVHATASPGPMLPGDLNGLTQAAKFTGYKFLTGDPPEHYAQVLAAGIPLSNCITRLFRQMNDEEPKPTPQQFCDEQALAITEAMSAGVTWFEIHNEPNLVSEWPFSTDPHDFIAWYLQVVAILRAAHRNIKLISPGLSPQPNTPQWWQDFKDHGVFDVSDAIGAHAYWPSREVMLTPEQGLNFLPLLPLASLSKPLFITECANNINGDTDYDKGAQYVAYWAYLQANYPTVTRLYVYALSSNTPSDNTTRQTIVRQGIVSDIARGIREAAVTPPAPQTYVYSHSHLDGGAENTAPEFTVVMNANHVIDADYVLAQPVRFFLRVTVRPAEAGSARYTLNPPQPVDGYPAGTIVTVKFT